MSKRVVLLTGARAPAALEWARQLAAEGWRVLAADSMPGPLASWSRAVDKTWRVPPARQAPQAFLKAIAGICGVESVDVVLPICEEIFTLAAGCGLLPARTRLWTGSFDQLQELHDKAAFIRLAGRLGLPVPSTIRVTSPDEVVALSGDWFLKPCYSRFAAVGRRWSPVGAVGHAAATAWLDSQEISPVRPWVAQEFLAGQGWCAYALAEEGRVLSQVCYPVEWTAGAGACVAFTATPHPEVEAWVRRFIGAAGLTGQLAFDFISVPGRGVLPLECNPRATSGIHLLPDAAGILTKLWLGQKKPMRPAGPDKDGCAIRQDEPDRPLQSGSPHPVSAMLSLPMLLYGLPQAVKRGAAAEWLHTWRSSREVAAAPGDFAPALGGSLWTLAWFAWEARRMRCGLTEATTADLEWNGPSGIPLPPG